MGTMRTAVRCIQIQFALQVSTPSTRACISSLVFLYGDQVGRVTVVGFEADGDDRTVFFCCS